MFVRVAPVFFLTKHIASFKELSQIQITLKLRLFMPTSVNRASIVRSNFLNQQKHWLAEKDKEMETRKGWKLNPLPFPVPPLRLSQPANAYSFVLFYMFYRQLKSNL